MIEKNLKQFLRYVKLGILFPLVYRLYSFKPVQANKVIIIEVRLDNLSNSLKLLYESLDTKFDFDIHVHFLHSGFTSREKYLVNGLRLIKDAATAKYIFLSDATNIFGRVHIREECIITQLWHGCGAFKKFGFSTADLKFGETRHEMLKYPNYKYNTYFTISSPEVRWAYKEATGLGDNNIVPWGISRTDVFFNQQFIKHAKNKFRKLMPSAEGKKVILFAPTFRGRVASAETSLEFSYSLFYENLAHDYVLIVKHHPFVKSVPAIPVEYQKFAVDFTCLMDIEELLCIADICISDYSSLIFEFSLFEKPMIFFAYDLDEYYDWRGFYYDYQQLTPGPVCQSNEQMIQYIKNIDCLFDKKAVIDFKNKFMSACDGHSTERILQNVFSNPVLNMYKK